MQLPLIDNLHGIIVFLRVVEHGSLSAAARQLGVSAAAVSGTLARLEKRLSVKLLHRTTRHLSLTTEGEEYYSRCKRIVSELESAELAVRAAAGSPTGKLRISMPSALARMWVIPRLPEFREHYPDVELEFMFAEYISNAVEAGLDISVQIGLLHDSRLAFRKLADVPYVICASPRYLAARGIPLTPDDLASHQCIAYRRPRDGRIWPWWIKTGPSVQRIMVESDLVLNSNEAVTAAAVAGLGIGQVAEHYAYRSLVSGELVEVLRDYKADGYTISVVFPKTDQVPPKVRVFIDFLVEIFNQPPWASSSPVSRWTCGHSSARQAPRFGQ